MKRFVILGIMLLLLTLQWKSLQGQSYTMTNGQNIITCSGVFYDPGGDGENYSNDLDITQTFASSDPNLCLQVTFSSFELEYYGVQKWDYLEIYDGFSTNSILIGKFCGNSQYGGDIPTTITSSSGALTFVFHSDGSTTAEGWVATFNCVECPPPPPIPSTEDNMHNGVDTIFCSQDPRPFYDPGGPFGDYGNNSNFTQTFVSSDPDKCLQVTFTNFATEPGYDVLYVYDGVSSSGTLLGNYSGARTSFSVTSNSGALTFVFQSDNMFRYDGWEATLSCVECADPADNMHDGIDTVYCSQSPRYFYDPGGPNDNYDYGTDIVQTFVSSDPDSCLQVTFTSINVETRWDILYVYDGFSTSGTLLGVFSGAYNNITLVSSTGALTFRFKSDNLVNYAGWEATISCSECAEPLPPLPPPPSSNPCEANGIHPFCTDENPYGITYSSGASGDASSFLDKDSCSCLRTIPNPAWYYMQVSDSGDLLINIQQVDAYNENHGLDVDFICWGPFTASSQSDFVDKLCNNEYSLDCYSHPSHHPADGNHQNDMGGYPDGNVVDCSYSIFETEWCYIPNAQLGEWYLLLITNYSEIPGTITFSVVDEYSTATTNCNLLAPVTYNAPLCQGDTLVLTCENPQADATYHWSGPGGWSAVTTVPYVMIPNAGVNQSGQYNLYITGLSSTVDSSSVDVNIHARPQVTITASTDSICSGSSVTLQAAGAATYRWLSTSNVTSSIIVAPDSTATYAVVGTIGVCTDTATYVVTVLRNTTGDTSVVTCDRFDWYEHEGLYEDGDYTHTFTNAAGCDSVVTLHLTVGSVPEFTVYTNYTSICVGDTITLKAEADDESIPLSYQWSNGATASEITVSPDQTTEYTVTATNRYGCSDSLSLVITVGMDVSQTFYDTVCQGAGYDSYGFTLTEEETDVPGLLTLTSADTNHGCIFTTILLLTIQESFDTTLYITACENYEWNDSVYTESGVYTEHYWNVNGCDSTVNLYLTIGRMFDVAITVSSDTICQGDSVMLTAEVHNGDFLDYSYHWSTGDTTSYIVVSLEETTRFAVTVTDTVGCSVSISQEVEIFELEPITDVVYRCCDSSVVITARDAIAYQWNTGDTLPTVTATASGLYFVTVTPFFGCPVVDTFKVVTMLVNAFSDIHIPEMCAGGSFPLYIGHDSTSDLRIQTHETQLALHDTLFISDSSYCDSSGCYHRSLLQLGNYYDTSRINSVDDIRYVRINMEHSYAGDLYMKLTCPNGQSADILRYGNAYQYENRGDCWDEIPSSSFEWQTGDTNANLSTYFGLAMDNSSSANPCDIMDSDNAPGVGWNYCWSNNTSEGYTYAAGEGSLVYRQENVIISAESGLFHYVFDSSNVAAGTQFYHPDQSFESLVGCPLNGLWYIEVIDGNNVDNGYIFGWELALSEDYEMVEYADMSHITVEGPWVTTIVSDSSFLISPPVDLPHDTTVSYTFHGYSLYGCSYDTTVSVNFFANKMIIVDTVVCDSLLWEGVIYRESIDTAFYSISSNGCDSTTVLHLVIPEDPIIDAHLSDMVAGDTQIVTFGMSGIDNLQYINPQTTLVQSDTVFLPDGVSCEPYGCSYRASLTFSDFSDTARILSAEDIRYVRLNMEHSFIRDLYINITCPDGQNAAILKKYNGNSFSNCSSSIPLSDIGWQNGNNVVEAFLGLAYDNNDENDKCDKTLRKNRPGVGWNYCWSDNTTEGIQYASGDGLIYRSANAHNCTVNNYQNWVIDSSNVVDKTQFYHPDVSFDSLVGCRLNGTWTVEVMDGITNDNGYLFSWEISLSDRLMPHQYASVVYKHLEGSWVTRLTDTSFVITPPDTLSHDTLVTYNFILTDINGCSFDTTVSIQVYAHKYADVYDTVYVDSLETYSWHGYSFNHAGCLSDTIYQFMGPDSAKVDSVVTMHLSVVYPFDKLVCENDLPTEWHGYIFEEADTVMISYPVENCADSIELLRLAVNLVTSADTVVKACDSFTWYDHTYYETPEEAPTIILTNAVGCDSVVTLLLTVSPSYNQIAHDTIIMDDLPYTWRDTVFEQGTVTDAYVFHRSSIDECDSTVTLFLVVKQIAYGDTIVTACDSFTWREITYYETPEIAPTDTIFGGSQNGYDSVTVLHLTVNHTTDSLLTIRVVERNLPFVLNEKEYWESGTYYDTISNMAGCDSLLTLDLTVLYNVLATVDSTICISEIPFLWNGVTFLGADTQTVTLRAVNGADSILTMSVQVLPLPGVSISGIPMICNGEPTVLTADSAVSYLWSNGDTTQSINVTTRGQYQVTVWDENGCSNNTSVQVQSTFMNPIDNVLLPELCAGDTFLFTVGHQSTSNIHIGEMETTLSLADTIFLPDGVSCDPYGCSYRSSLTFSAYMDDAVVTDVNDILYVRLNLEHSYASDLYIRLICPSGEKADILRFNGTLDSDCSDSIPITSRGWQSGNNASKGTFFGQAYDFSDITHPCDSTTANNAPGRGWNYCWSNNTSQDYQYASGVGSLIYRASNASSYGSFFNLIRIFDSSNVAAGTQFYHPDESFQSLVGCPLNGSWYIEVMDGYSVDNGYIFGWELALTPEILTVDYSDVTNATVEGPWVDAVNDTTFLIMPPDTLSRDTTIFYRFYLFDDYGCSYDTLLPIRFYHRDTVFLDTTACDSYSWNGVVYTSTGQYLQTFPNIHGCDSLVTLQLIIYNSSELTYDTLTLLESELPYYFEPANISFVTPENMSFQYTLRNQYGCDSVVQQQVYIYSNEIKTFDTTVCSLPLMWKGHLFTAQGSITDSLKTYHNTDSIVTYTVNVDNMSAAIENVSHVICYGASTGSAVANVTGGQNPLSYQWKDNAGNPLSITLEVNDVMAGIYSFTVTDSLGCGASDTMTIRNLHEELIPGAIAGDQSVCQGDALAEFMGDVASGGDNGGYQWQMSNDGSSWIDAPGIANTQNYTYPEIPSDSSFRLRRAWMTESCGSVYSNAVDVTIWPTYLDTLSAAVCQGDVYMENGFEIDETMTETPGLFTFEQRLSTAHCDSVIVLQLVVNPYYENEIEDEVCEGEDYFANGFVVLAYETVGADTLQRTLNMQTEQGCDSVVRLHLTVVDTALQIICMTPDFCDDMSAELTVVTRMTDYQWSTGEQMPQITVTSPGRYSVTATQGDCQSTAKFVIEPCEFQFVLPNAITPGRGDGLNDYFYIPEHMQYSIQLFEITIFNRWGEQVFYSTDKSFKWNGEVNGKIYYNNVYTYIIRCTNAAGKQYQFKGSVTVL